MPQTHPTTPAPGLVPAPVAVLLPIPDRPDGTPTPVRDTGRWCGLDARTTARLIAVYTRAGDTVVDLDASPLITQAARWLDRNPTPVLTHSKRQRMVSRPDRHRLRRPGRAGLVTVSLPRDGLDTTNLPALTAAMSTWRALLRPGGYLLAALADIHHGTLITAAHSVGLTYHQHLIGVHTRLPEHEPRAVPDTAGAIATALIHGRHRRAHVDLLAFSNPTGGNHA